MAIIIEIGKTLEQDGKKYIATVPDKHGLCAGCELQFFNGEYNECHAPDGLYCTDRIFKEQKSTPIPVYERDEFFDYDYDFNTTGAVTMLSVLGAFVGAALAAIGTALYYLINSFI